MNVIHVVLLKYNIGYQSCKTQIILRKQRFENQTPKLDIFLNCKLYNLKNFYAK
jgi:hypothetical protein